VDTSVKQKLDDFFQKYKFQKYRKGEVLIRADDDPPGIFYLTSGVIRRYSISASGEELTLNIFKPFSMIPMSWAINRVPSSHYFEAMTDVEVWRAPVDDVLTFVSDKPDILLDLLSRIYHGLEGYMMRMEYLMAGNAKARLITELLIYAKRFGQNQSEKTLVDLKLTEKDLASQSGISRETVSRELQKLRASNLITYKKNQLVINDLEKLEHELFD
jgi:CRP/FNR family transcriptional regulator, cyclic AMP receptor protein